MKKVFNLSIILAVLTAALTFSSCGGDEDAAEITITFNSNGQFASGDVVLATITSLDEKLTSIELWSGGSKLKNLTIPAEANGVYVLNIPGLDDGSYTLKVTSKTGAEQKDFRVGTPLPPTAPIVTSFTANAGDIYAYEYDGVPMGGFMIDEVAADGAGFKVSFFIGPDMTEYTPVVLSYTGKSFLTTNFTTKTGAEASVNTGADLLMYLDGTSKTINAGQLATFNGGAVAGTAKVTKFQKQN